MTIDEAIKNREDCLKYLEGIGPKASPDCLEAVRWSVKALKALRPVSREQVEKMRGEWIGDNEEKVGTIDGVPVKSATCSVCGNWLVGSDEYDCSGHFCPACGAPMTDEAVDMILERWKEALENG